MPEKGSWNVKGLRFKIPKVLQWLPVLTLIPPRTKLRDSVASFCNALSKNGLGTPTHTIEEVKLPISGSNRSIDPTALFEALEQGFIKLAKIQPVRLMMVILKDTDEDVYSIVKRWGDLRKGIPTVCVTDKNYTKDSRDGGLALWGNLALKVNLKLGGTNHTLSSDSYPAILKSKQGNPIDTMIVGADVTHPSRASMNGCPSIAGVVASIDGEFANYPGSMRLQTSKKEVSQTTTN